MLRDWRFSQHMALFSCAMSLKAHALLAGSPKSGLGGIMVKFRELAQLAQQRASIFLFPCGDWI